MTILERTIEALKNLGGQAAYSDIYQEYARLLGKNIDPGEKAAIRKVIEDHSSDSRNFKGKNDIFYSVKGIGNGVWGLRK
ncbi:hypothetical protein [Ruminococcus sp.]|uniref:hypothetical protein n=1 Tax=Ruminococcus sp. TaxID=41978 RepID=UPI0025F4B57B|nr:hypothetical protein [Ruminococcus sp.]